MALQRSLTWSAAAYLAATCLTLPLPAAAQMADRVEVPITQTALPDGAIRYSVPVSFGGNTGVMAMLDTGSLGLRVLSKALSAPQAEDTGIVRDFPFQSGIVLHGPLIKTTVSVGDATSPEPLVIQSVQEVKCGEMKPDCPVSKMDTDSYGIGGDGIPNQGFQAILGLAMRKMRVPMYAGNPVSGMGAQAWIVELPRPGDPNPGRLIINPSPAERQGFKMSPVPQQALTVGGGAGGPGGGAGPGPGGAGPGPGVGGGNPEQRNSFTLCTTKTKHCPTVKLDTGAGPNALETFYSYAILFDQAHNSIGAKPRPAAASE
jgi:hypothetical protein